MRKLCTLTLAVVLFASLYLAGCDSITSTGPTASERNEVGDIDINAVGQSLFAGKADKTDVCHKRDDQDYILISVADAAFPSHAEHGDGGIGDPVPDMLGFIFDENCVPVDCPCWDAADLLSITVANHLTGGNSCSTAEIVFTLPFGAFIQNAVSRPTVEGGFAASRAGAFFTDPACFTRDFDPFVLLITVAEADACIQQVVDRCAAVLDFLPPPQSAAAKAPSVVLDPSSIWGSQ